MSDAAKFAMLKTNIEVGGKSGKFYYSTENNQFLVQTASDNELSALVNLMRKVYDHHKYSQSVLKKYYGIYEIKSKDLPKINVVLMRNNANVIRANNRIALEIDLKGYQHERQNLFGNDFLYPSYKIDLS